MSSETSNRKGAMTLWDGEISDQFAERLVGVLDELIDIVGEDENHPLASLMDEVGALIEKYEDEHVPELEAGGNYATGGI